MGHLDDGGKGMAPGGPKASTPTQGGERSTAATAAAAAVPNNFLPHDGRLLLRLGWAAAGAVDVDGTSAAASFIVSMARTV